MKITANQSALDGVEWLDAPLVFAGAPGRCYAVLPVRNQRDEKVNIKSARARVGDQEYVVHLAARLAPRSELVARGQLALPPATPPGDYTGELELCGQRRKFEAHVHARVALEVQPPTLDYYTEGGKEVPACLCVANVGNVELDLPKALLVPLSREHALHTSFHEAVIEKSAAGHQATLDELVRRFASTELKPAVVKLASGAERPLAPGETRAVSLQIGLPAPLARRARYLGQIRLFNASVRLCVEGRRAPGTAQPEGEDT